jgi:formiminotetrahydrofolate cyclodeaminase
VGVELLGIGELVAQLAATGPGPRAGTGAAVAAAAGAALAEGACRVSSVRWEDAQAAADRLVGLRAELLRLADEDAVEVGAAIAAGHVAPGAGPPLSIAERAAETAELAALAAIHGKRTVRGDALAGSLLAEAAARAAANLVAIDLADRSNPAVARARWAAERAEAAAERAWRAARSLP